jgi:hypothetical protein
MRPIPIHSAEVEISVCKLLKRSTSVVGVLCLLAAATPVFGQVLGTNLIQNGDAESGIASPDAGVTLTPVTGWTTTDRFVIVPYSSSDWPTVSDPGPTDRGNNLFVGGRPSAVSSATQTVDISSWAANVDGIGVAYTLSAWLGGWLNQNDNAVLQAHFLGTSGLISEATLGPVTAADRGNVTSLVFHQTTGTIPAGTRSIDFILTMTREAGSDNDGYADNLSFVATAVPEPEAYATIVGACGFGFVVLRRAQRKLVAFGNSQN